MRLELFVFFGTKHFCFLLFFPAFSSTSYHYFSNVPAWMVVIANSFPIGIIGVWGPVLGVNLKQLDVTQVSCSVFIYPDKTKASRSSCFGNYFACIPRSANN